MSAISSPSSSSAETRRTPTLVRSSDPGRPARRVRGTAPAGIHGWAWRSSWMTTVPITRAILGRSRSHPRRGCGHHHGERTSVGLTSWATDLSDATQTVGSRAGPSSPTPTVLRSPCPMARRWPRSGQGPSGTLVANEPGHMNGALSDSRAGDVQEPFDRRTTSQRLPCGVR